ncbi:hypothetical protein, partial [Actinoplanes philippinensis]|uniref:hypothetical protein n=1 Tax=Actinoplanes philippinensis TaxID=35752 RepID=UPI0033C3FD20
MVADLAFEGDLAVGQGRGGAAGLHRGHRGPQIGEQRGQHRVAGRAHRARDRGDAPPPFGPPVHRTGAAVLQREIHPEAGERAAVGGHVRAQLGGAEQGLLVLEDPQPGRHGPQRAGAVAAGAAQHRLGEPGPGACLRRAR